MKRYTITKPKLKYKKFWGRKKCHRCGSEFKHEYMWRAVKRELRNYDRHYWYVYFCTHCMPTEKDITSYINNRAEDFRYLFGVDKGDKFWGHPIEPPNNDIKDFILSL